MKEIICDTPLPGDRHETISGRGLCCCGQSDFLQAKHFHVVGRREEDVRCSVEQNQGYLLNGDPLDAQILIKYIIFQM